MSDARAYIVIVLLSCIICGRLPTSFFQWMWRVAHKTSICLIDQFGIMSVTTDFGSLCFSDVETTEQRSVQFSIMRHA